MKLNPKAGGGHDEPAALGSSSTVKEILNRHKISRTLWRNMQESGTGPRLMRLGRAIRISAEAERQWISEREQSSGPKPEAPSGRRKRGKAEE